MNKKDVIELFNENSKDCHAKQLIINLTVDNPYSIGFVITYLLPAIRDTKQFQEGFWAWMDKNKYAKVMVDPLTDNEKGYGLCESVDGEPYDKYTNKMLLGYELDYIKQIFAEGV
jgi:hypothetical protein